MKFEKKLFIPGRPQFKRDCQNITTSRTTTTYEEIEKTEEIKSKKCDPDMKVVCHNLTIPKYEVIYIRTIASFKYIVTVLYFSTKFSIQ